MPVETKYLKTKLLVQRSLHFQLPVPPREKEKMEKRGRGKTQFG